MMNFRFALILALCASAMGQNKNNNVDTII